ncbi:MAG: AMP-binding protein, partial [Candidatus Babeliales bacterium]
MFLKKIIKVSEKNLDKNAIIFGSEKLTYRELFDRAKRVALTLTHKGLKKGDAVVLYQKRDIDLIPNILGIFLAGGVYVPVDHKFPQKRLDEIIEQVKPFYVIDDNFIPCAQASDKSYEYELDDLAYVLFTSGSTGKSKGVCLTYKNLESFLIWAEATYTNADLEVTLFSTSISFDLSIFEIFVPLLKGQSILLVEKIIDLIEQDLVPTLINTVPSAMQTLVEHHRIPITTRIVNIAGEALSQKIVDDLYKFNHIEKVYNLYGPTECTTYATCFLAQRNIQETMVPIGTPLSNSRVIVVDEYLKQKLPGQKGEILIGGDCVGLGYYNQPDLTDKKFVNIPYYEGKFYRTGDIGYVDNEGNLAYVGRMDDQIKLRGFRIELLEIEARLLQISGVSIAVVIFDKELQALHAFVKSALSTESLTDKLQEYLPEYMIPKIHTIESFPLNNSGKIDRLALKNTLKNLSINVEHTSTHEIVHILQNILKVSNIDLNLNFFELGGHSLLATQLMFNIKKILGWPITMKDIFQAPSINSLIEKFDNVNRTSKLYAWEEKYISFEKINTETCVYNLPIGFNLNKSYQVQEIYVAVEQLQTLYPHLKTRFIEASNGYQRLIGATIKLSIFEQYDKKIIQDFVFTPFKIINGELVRFGLFANKYFVICCHHSLVDGVAIKNLARNFLNILNKQFVIAHPVIEWESNSEQLSFWSKNIANLDNVLNWPSFNSRSERFDYKGNTLSITISKKKLSNLYQLLFQNHTNISTAMFALFSLVLAKFCRQSNVVIGVPFANRQSPGEEQSLGCFVNLLPITVDFSDKQNFISLLLACRDNIWEGLANQRVLTEDILKLMHIHSSLSHNPLFQAVFVVLPNMSDLEQQFGVDEIHFDFPHAKFDCTLQFKELKDEIILGFEYATSLLTKAQADLFIKMFLANIDLLSQNGDFFIRDIVYPISNEPKKLMSFAKTETIVDCFEKTLKKFKDNIAIYDNLEPLTYQFLDFKSSCLAKKIIDLSNKEYVAIQMHPCSDLIISILAVLKAGKAYIPIDPMIPRERMEYILNDANIDCLITDQNSLHIATAAVINPKETGVEPLEKISIKPDGHAYVIYTSGTTGNPKGVVVTHHNVVRLFKTTQHKFNFDENDRWCLFHSFGFDFSVWEIWGALFYGGTLYIPEFKITRSPIHFFKYLETTAITVLNQTPSALRTLLGTWNTILTNLRVVVLGGEALELPLVDIWNNAPNAKQTQLVNMYGITETTVHTTYCLVRNSFASRSIIGRELDDLEIILVDEDLNIVPDSLLGEIIIRGDGVANGYLNKPELTKQKFIEHVQYPGEYLYRSGDLAQRCPD